MLVTRGPRQNARDSALLNAAYRVATATPKGVAVGVSKAAFAAATVNELAKAGKAVYTKVQDMSRKQPQKLRGSNLQSAGSSTYAPVSVGSRLTSQRAMITPTSSGTRVKYRELINSSVTGGISFPTSFTPGVTSFQVNPGLSKLYPWLSPQAVQYEQYRIHSQKFIFVPYVSTAIAGDVMMMMDYNVLDPPPTTEAQFLDHPGAVIGSVWECQEFRCQPASMHAIGPRKFVRPCAVAGDLKTYDCGNFYIATNNVSAGTSSVGKLFVEYDIEFFTPQLVPSPATTPSGTSLYAATGQALSTGASANMGFNVSTYDPLGIGLNPSGVFTPPAGCYDIFYSASASAGTALTSIGLSINKNGSTAAGSTVTVSLSSTAAVTYYTLSTRFVVPCNGTDTISVSVITTGTGALAATNEGIIIWSLA